MRHIQQPGPVVEARVQWVEARGRAFPMELRAGARLLDAVQRGFAAAGFASGVLPLTNAALDPLAYVMPALSPTPDHAAFYSAVFRPEGVARISSGAMTFGSRDRQPFFHGHALWREADGKLSGGHILPEETMIAETFSVHGLGLDGAEFAAEADPETRFNLFGPVIGQASQLAASARVFALRLRPNQDVATALELFCQQRGIASATLHGGVGSIIGAHFADGRRIEPFATEIAIRTGRIMPGRDGGPEALLDVALVDYTGALAQGRLQRGDNPVLMTLELVLEPD